MRLRLRLRRLLQREAVRHGAREDQPGEDQPGEEVEQEEDAHVREDAQVVVRQEDEELPERDPEREPHRVPERDPSESASPTSEPSGVECDYDYGCDVATASQSGVEKYYNEIMVYM